ncbi:MAG: winged helix DNA-binding protein [Lachnospiraceae bacterium]|nr:winged helix DNA-binding protein [Lachnospiraceae bacterium]
MKRKWENRMKDIIKDLFKIVHRFHKCRPKFRGNGNLANVEFFILCGISVMLEGREEGITLGELIKETDMSMSAASKKITILEKKGLIERHTSETDRRNVYIKLTEKGKEISDRERALKNQWIKKVIERMGIDDTRQMLALMNKMFDIIEEMEKEQAAGREDGV